MTGETKDLALTQRRPVPLVAAQWLDASPGVVPILGLISGGVLAIRRVKVRALHKSQKLYEFSLLRRISRSDQRHLG